MKTMVCAALLALMWIPAGGASADETGDSRRPLREYCNHSPDFSVLRTDAVDNWVRVCSVWFQYNPTCRESESASRPKPEKKAEQ